MNARQVTFVAMMSSLGALLSAISLNVAPILAAAGAGGAALDLSHIATFIAAIFGGPYIGAIVGFLSGIYAGYYFGYVLGSLGILSLIGVPLGKALTGLVAGFLYKGLKISNRSRSSMLTIPIVLLSYIPESIYTIVYFVYIVTLVYGFSMSFMIPIVMPKAWLEILVMSLIMSVLVGRESFRKFVKNSYL
jgi:LytS/YehU family sensor histidine kinase